MEAGRGMVLRLGPAPIRLASAKHGPHKPYSLFKRKGGYKSGHHFLNTGGRSASLEADGPGGTVNELRKGPDSSEGGMTWVTRRGNK